MKLSAGFVINIKGTWLIVFFTFVESWVLPCGFSYWSRCKCTCNGTYRCSLPKERCARKYSVTFSWYIFSIIKKRINFFLMCVYIYMCVCVCVCIYIYVCVCVCLCVHTLIHIHIYFECISFRQIQKYQIGCYFCVRKLEFFLLFNDALKTFLFMAIW